MNNRSHGRWATPANNTRQDRDGYNRYGSTGGRHRNSQHPRGVRGGRGEPPFPHRGGYYGGAAVDANRSTQWERRQWNGGALTHHPGRHAGATRDDRARAPQNAPVARRPPPPGRREIPREEQFRDRGAFTHHPGRHAGATRDYSARAPQNAPVARHPDPKSKTDEKPQDAPNQNKPDEKEWNDMSDLEKLKDLLPNESLHSLAPCDSLPSKSRIEKAVDALKSLVQERIKDEQSGQRKRKNYDSDDGEEFREFDDIVSPHENTVAFTLMPYLPFLYKLPECIALNYGFHTVVSRIDADKWCYCPCSKRMSTWRKRFNLEGLYHDHTDDHCLAKKMTPNALMNHLESGKQKTLHWIVQQYLLLLYTNFWESKQLNHRALYDMNNDKYKSATAVQMETFLEKVNPDKAKEVKRHNYEKENLLEKLQVTPIPQRAEFSDEEELEKLRGKRDDLFKQFRESRRVRSGVKGITLSVPPKFTLQQLFESWLAAKNDTSYLFRDLVSSVEQAKLLTRWDVQIQASVKADGDSLQAVDDGGPSRAFLSEVWRQMADLKVSNGDEKSAELFYRCKNGNTVPNYNSVLGMKLGLKEDDDGVCELALPFCRALGRIMLYCLAMDYTCPLALDLPKEKMPKQRFVMASHVMPNIYRNYLIRGVEPTDESLYPISDLVRDVVTIKLNSRKDWQTDAAVMSTILEVSGLDDSVLEDGPALQSAFREWAKEDLLDSRRIVLDAIRKGLSLDEQIDLSLFKEMSIEEIGQMFFARADLNIEHVISVLECAGYSEDSPKHSNAQKLVLLCDGGEVTGALPAVLRDLAKEKPDFSAKFLEFATGCSYMPPASDKKFKITVEFNGEDEESRNENSLVVSHTCANTIKLPLTAYNGDQDELRSKLFDSVELSSDSFGMQ